jgi:hypothetical protein
MKEGDILQYSHEGKLVNGKLLDKTLENGTTRYLVEEQGNGAIYLIFPKSVHVINP